MSLARGRELKLELTHDELLRVRSHPALGNIAIGEPVTRRTRSLYFDTPDHRLRSLGFFVRLRSEGNGWLQTIEGTDRRAAAGLPDKAQAIVAGPEPDVHVISDRHVRRTLKKVLKRSRLAPVFETVVERTTRRLHASGADVQLALDEGFVRAGDAQDSLCGAELELKSGNPEGLLNTATRLFADTPVRFPAGSAAEKGYGLARGELAVGSGPRAGLLELRADQSCGDALSLLVDTAAEQIAASRSAVLENNAPVAAHQLRIGLRRLRSALVAFRPLADTPVLRDLEEQARTLAHSVGVLRDADVLIEDICGPVTGTMREDLGLVQLNEALATHREDARQRVRSELCGRPWSMLQLKLALCRNGSDGEALAVPIGDFARSAMRRRWRKVAACGERLEHLSIEERHAMRKALKRLRYTADFLPASTLRDRRGASSRRCARCRRCSAISTTWRARNGWPPSPMRPAPTAGRHSGRPAIFLAGTMRRRHVPGGMRIPAGRSSTPCGASGRDPRIRGPASPSCKAYLSQRCNRTRRACRADKRTRTPDDPARLAAADLLRNDHVPARGDHRIRHAPLR